MNQIIRTSRASLTEALVMMTGNLLRLLAAIFLECKRELPRNARAAGCIKSTGDDLFSSFVIGASSDRNEKEIIRHSEAVSPTVQTNGIISIGRKTSVRDVTLLSLATLQPMHASGNESRGADEMSAQLDPSSLTRHS